MVLEFILNLLNVVTATVPAASMEGSHLQVILKLNVPLTWITEPAMYSWLQKHPYSHLKNKLAY